MTDAPLAKGDGLNYMNKRTSVGIGVNTMHKLGESEEGQRSRVFPAMPFPPVILRGSPNLPVRYS